MLNIENPLHQIDQTLTKSIKIKYQLVYTTNPPKGTENKIEKQITL